ncbi:CNNM domain-containing protein [Thalassotalea ganghwensis]
MTLLFIYLAIAIGVSFLCSILEAVLLSVSSSYVLKAQKDRPKGGKVLKQVKDNLDKSISSILILNTFAHTMGAAGVGAQAVRIFGEEKEALIAFLLTLAILYFSEIIPKTLGATYWRRLAIPSAYLIALLVKLVYPLVWLSSKLTQLFSRGDQQHISREEVLAFAALSHKEGAIAHQESQLLENVLSLRDVRTTDIFTPRSVVHAFALTTTVSQALEHPQTANFTRMPIFENSIDHIKGVVLKEQLYIAERNGQGDTTLETLMTPLYSVSENMPVSHLLDIFIKRQEHIFLVQDQFGQTEGIVTLEDAIETFLGREIVDESDQVEDLQKLAKANYRKRLKAKFNKVADLDSDDINK